MTFTKAFRRRHSRSKSAAVTERPEADDRLSRGIDLVRGISLIVLAFLLGFLGAFHVNVIGNLGVNEILLLAVAPFLLPTMIQSRTVRRHRVIILLGVLYLLSQILSDLYRHSVPDDYLRGWAKIGITLIAFLVTSAVFVRRSSALIAFVIGAFLVGPMTVLMGEALDPENEGIYKLFIGPTVSMFVFLILSFRTKIFKMPSSVLAVGAGVLAFLQNARSLAGITLLSVVTYWVGRFRLLTGHGMSKKKLLLPAVVFLVASYGILEAYRYAAPRGMLGEQAIDKYEHQAQLLNAESFSILSGRLELLFSGPKILRSPLIGYGSWAKDVDYVYNRAVDLGLDPDAIVNANSLEPGAIPSHSHVFGAWLEAGLAGAIFWSFALYLALHILIRQKFVRHPALAALMNYLIVTFVWDLIFSPFGATRRVWDGFLLAWMAAIYYKSRQGDKNGSEHGLASHAR